MSQLPRVVAYLDTSALVKLYVAESGQQRVTDLVDSVDGGLVTSVITYAEARGVFARYLRENKIDQHQHDTLVANFNADWEGMNEVDVTPSVYQRAGDLLTAHPNLRAMDAIQMSSALEARSHARIKFLTFDDDLEAVAKALLRPQELA